MQIDKALRGVPQGRPESIASSENRGLRCELNPRTVGLRKNLLSPFSEAIVSRLTGRAIMVLGISVGALASAPPEEANATMRRDICNTSFSAHCLDKSINEIRFICDNFCPAWTSAQCFEDGSLSCNIRDQ